MTLSRRRRCDGPRRGQRACVTTVIAFAAFLALTPSQSHAQVPDDGPDVVPFEVTPIGALPPMALPMPASRDDHYWAFRLQSGWRQGRLGPDMLAVAGGVDLQWHGGSLFGLTGGYQVPDCGSGPGCDGHLIFGARGRFNVITAGPTIGAWLGDYSATSTLGAEIGFGFAPDISPDQHACTLDIGMPLSLAMLQRVRLVSYITPGVIWDVDCARRSVDRRTDYYLGAGVAVQQLGLPGLDVHLGIQKVFRTGTGYQFGLSVMYVRLP